MIVDNKLKIRHISGTWPLVLGLNILRLVTRKCDVIRIKWLIVLIQQFFYFSLISQVSIIWNVEDIYAYI